MIYKEIVSGRIPARSCISCKKMRSPHPRIRPYWTRIPWVARFSRVRNLNYFSGKKSEHFHRVSAQSDEESGTFQL